MDVLFVGVSGFPFGLAAIEKQKIIAKGLINNGNSVKVLCKNPEHHKKLVNRKGVYEEIQYQYTSIFTYRKKNFILRNINKAVGKLLEPFYIVFANTDIIIALSRDFYSMFMYKLLSYLKGIPLTMLVHEDNTFKASRKYSLEWFNQKLYNKYIWSMLDAAIPISNYLKELILLKKPSLKQFVLPALTDFDLIINTKTTRKENYFLFCGGASYYEVIEFIIESFELITSNKYDLIIISSGNETNINRIKKRIRDSRKANKIKLLSFLEYSELIEYYKGSTALLIPLRNKIQDIARFPHKVSEYCASGRTIITTKYGEPAKYFKHRNSALIANEYSPQSFAKEMNFIIDNPDFSRIIASNSYKIGYENFDYKSKTKLLSNFLIDLCSEV